MSYTAQTILVLLLLGGFILFALIDEHRNRDDVQRLIDERRDRQRAAMRDV